MDALMRAALLARYKLGYQEVAATVQGLSEAELDAAPLAGDGWTPRQIVHHLADSEMTSALRLRRLLAEEQPVLASYDEEAFARNLYYDRPIAASLEALRAARATTAEILDRLSEAEWGRAGTHEESGRYTVETWLEIYAAHAHDHAAQIRAALAGPAPA
jgi:hypothetical protein